MATYLKDILALIPGNTVTARVDEIGPQETNKNGKNFHKIKFWFPSTGKDITEGVFDFNFGDKGSLRGMQVGNMVEIKLDKGWPVYKLLSATAETATVQPSQSSFQQVKSERAATEAINEREEKQEQKSIEICLQGFAQAFIIQGKTIDEALSLAVEARKKLIAKSGEVRLGITMPVQTTSIEEVESAFGGAPPPNSPADYL
jgi:hypothetical protein